MPQLKNEMEPMPVRRKLIAGNWKMNGLRAAGLELAKDLAERLRAAGPVGFDMLVCPPATLVHSVAEAVAGTPLAVGGQDCHVSKSGAHTGDISAVMLADSGQHPCHRRPFRAPAEPWGRRRPGVGQGHRRP